MTSAAPGSRAAVAGEAVKDAEDFFGRNVVFASRVAAAAAGGEVLVSEVLRELVRSSVPAGTFASPRKVTLKGLAGEHDVYAVDLESVPA